MIGMIGATSIERFRNIVAHGLGLHFEEAKLAFLDEVLHRRLKVTGQQCESYLAALEAEAPRSELGLLAQELTVGETYFFRNVDQFRAFSEVALPDRMRSQKRVRILSAACASGDEAYSLAILIREAVSDSSCDVSILAVDVNPTMIEKARRGRFSAWALRETPPEIKRQWFRSEGRDIFQLDPGICAAVRFEQRNLVADEPELWRSEAYDIIFCRNVIMYFTPDSSRTVVARATRSLVPGGYLFLGHAETLRGLSQDFHLCHTHETFYYQRKDRVDASVHRSPINIKSPSTFVGSAPPIIVESSDTWIDAIGRAAERIQALTETPQPHAVSSRDAAAAYIRPAWDLAVPLELLRKERFSEALDLIQALPPESTSDPDVLLLHAVLLAHGSLLTKSEALCRRLLEVEELNAGAHYVLALCREGAGDRPGAVDHDQVAVYLDPGFAMPHLHLGLLARRRGDHEAAERELGQALTLLQREDASRLLLFGGGFSRDALLWLCRAELSAVGGKA